MSSSHDHPTYEGVSEDIDEVEAQTQDEDVSKIVKASKLVRLVKKELSCSEGTGDGETVREYEAWLEAGEPED